MFFSFTKDAFLVCSKISAHMNAFYLFLEQTVDMIIFHRLKNRIKGTYWDFKGAFDSTIQY